MFFIQMRGAACEVLAVILPALAESHRNGLSAPESDFGSAFGTRGRGLDARAGFGGRIRGPLPGLIRIIAPFSCSYFVFAWAPGFDLRKEGGRKYVLSPRSFACSRVPAPGIVMQAAGH